MSAQNTSSFRKMQQTVNEVNVLNDLSWTFHTISRISRISRKLVHIYEHKTSIAFQWMNAFFQ